MFKLHITLFLSLIWSFFYAQQYTNYNVKNGLPSNHVYRITQDYQGFIWFITDKGMVKYNGKTFKTFTTKEGLPSNDIWDIRIGYDNKVWFFSKATALGYIKNDKVFTFKSNLKNEILSPRIINQNKNNVFFSDAKKVFFLENKQWTSQTLIDKDGYIERIIHPKIKSLVFNDKQDILNIKNHQNISIKTLKIDKSFRTCKYRGQLNDSLFCWVSRKSMQLLNLNTLKLHKIAYTFGTRNFVRYSAVNNQIQFSGESFISFLDKNYQLKHTIQIPKHFHSHFSFVDKNKNLWIATFTNGVYFLPYAKQKATYNLFNQKVGKIQNVNGNIIANVYKKGFYKYDTTKNKFHPFLDIDDFIFSANYIKELDTYYYISDNQVIQIKNKIKTKYKRNDFAKKLIYFNKKLYGNTSFGITKINPKNLSIEREYAQNGIRNMQIFNHKILLATASGIKQFSKDKISAVFIGSHTFNKPITSLNKLDNNQLIVGTDGFGAYLTDLTKIKQLEQSEYLNIQSSFIKNKDIWLATNKGVWQYKKEGESVRLVKKYTTYNGLSLNQTNAVFILDDKLMASSNDGISIIPIHQSEKNQFIDLYFDEVTYNNKPIKNNKVTYKANNHLQVKIASIDFSSNKNVVYEYQLLPIQKKGFTTNSSQISFNDLPPNNYQLKIKSNGKENTINFSILPLWYQTLLAKISFGLLLLSFLIGIILAIKRRELKKQAKKLQAQKKLADFELHALRSQMNPHFVFNSLNAIQYFITKNEIDLSEKYLVKFARLIRMFFDFSRKKEIPLREEIKLLHSYLEIEKMRFGEDFSFQIHVLNPQLLDSFKIPTMLLQPIVENAVNHGLFHNNGKGLIEIFFELLPNSKLIVKITDNGVGIKKSKEIQKKAVHIKKDTSSNVIKERLFLLNQSKKWKVSYTLKEEKVGTSVTIIFEKNE